MIKLKNRVLEGVKFEQWLFGDIDVKNWTNTLKITLCRGNPRGWHDDER